MHWITTQDWGFSNRKEHSGRRKYQTSHILFACLLLHQGSQQLKHLSFQLCISLSYPQIFPPLLVNHPWQRSQPFWSLSQARRAKVVNLSDKDSLLGWTTPRHMLDSSTEGSTRPVSTVHGKTSLVTHLGLVFPPSLFPFVQSPTPVPLNHLPKISYMHTNSCCGLCFLRLPSPSEQRTWVPHTHAHLHPSLMCTHVHYTRQLGSIRVCFFKICIKEVNCSQGKWSICPFSLIRAHI